MFRSLRQFLYKHPIKPEPLDKAQFKNLPFSAHWDNYVKSFDLRMWYLRNGVNDEKRMECVHDLEKLHNELNYLWVRG